MLYGAVYQLTQEDQEPWVLKERERRKEKCKMKRTSGSQKENTRSKQGVFSDVIAAFGAT
jgi:hypothetical protein